MFRLIQLLNHSLLRLFVIIKLYHCTCPEACEPCMAGHLYCINPGLGEIPSVPRSGLQKVTIQRQRFLSTDLSSSNMSSFTGINQLSIRTSNINKVLPLTFSELRSLQQLDLSDNAELIIKQMAFFGLNLQILKLDNMGIITLDLDSFKGLSVRSLSIQNSNLLSLPFKLIEPLSKSLLKLYLKNNHLRTLEPQLQTIFRSIEVLELQKNPFICDCNVLWLSKLLQFSVAIKARTNDVTFESSDELFPSCVSPTELRKKFLHTITNKLRNCSPPNIIRIDVSFESYSSAIIDCFADDRKDSGHQTFVGWLPKHDTVIDVTQLKHSVKVDSQSSNQRHRCRAANGNGNSEIGLQIDWLRLPKVVNISLTRPGEDNNMARESHNIIWRNMFSLFEMIFAIFGTLLITVIMFLVICCCHGYCLHIPYLERERKLKYMTPPSEYDRGTYKDQRRFYETDIDGNLFPPPPPTPPPFPANRIML